MLYSVGIGTILGILSATAACRDEKEEQRAEQRRAHWAAVVAALREAGPDAQVPAAAPAPPRATVELPPQGFALGDVIGKTKRGVDQALGHGKQLEDGPWSYNVGKVSVLVVFEGGRAVFVSVQAPEFHGTDADRAAVLAWIQAPPDADLDSTHNFNFELGVWATGAQERQLARRDVAHAVTEGLRAAGGFGAGTASANYTRLEVSLQDDDSCTRAVLAGIARKYDLKGAGFDSMECTTMSQRAQVLQLR